MIILSPVVSCIVGIVTVGLTSGPRLAMRAAWALLEDAFVSRSPAHRSAPVRAD